MKITNHELAFLNSITEGKDLYGIRLHTPGLLNEHTYIEETMKALKKDGIVDGDRNLTGAGAGIAKLLEQYRNSKKYVQINHMHMGIQDNDKSVVLTKTNDGMYDLSCLYTVDALYWACMQFPVFREERFAKSCDETAVKMSYDKWMELMQGYRKSFFCVRVHNGQEQIQKDVYYWGYEKIFLYDGRMEDITEVSLKTLRQKMADYISINPAG